MRGPHVQSSSCFFSLKVAFKCIDVYFQSGDALFQLLSQDLHPHSDKDHSGPYKGHVVCFTPSVYGYGLIGLQRTKEMTASSLRIYCVEMPFSLELLIVSIICGALVIVRCWIIEIGRVSKNHCPFVDDGTSLLTLEDYIRYKSHSLTFTTI